MNFQEPAEWTFPVPISYAPGRLSGIADDCKAAQMLRPLIVTDRGSKDLPFIAELRDLLTQGGLRHDLYAEVSPNPRDTDIAAGRAQFTEGGHDGIIAIGGGSGLDGAKAICLVAQNDLDLWAFDFDHPSPDMSAHAPFPPIITIPTTAGTGAETESTGMITHSASTMKLCVWHPDLKPALTILDPELTIGLPRNLTAWTGCDALVHAIEAYCVPSFHPMCDGIALEAMRIITEWLPVAVEEPDNIDARGAMLVGSCLAGVSFLKGLGMVHAMSHMIGAEFDTHHGLTNAVILPTVLQFNAPEIRDKIPAMALAMGCADTSEQAFHAKVAEVLTRLDIPSHLTDIGVPSDGADRLAERISKDAAACTNPRQASLTEIEALLRTVLSRT